MKKRNLLKYILLLSLIMSFIINPVIGYSEETAPPVKVVAPSFEILDGRTGKVIFAQKSEESIKAGAVLPLLVSMAVYDNISLDEYMIVPKQAAGLAKTVTVGDKTTVTGLVEGERVKYSDLLHSVLLGRNLDAIMSCAIGISKDEGTFLSLISEKINKLGLKNTKITSLTDAQGQNMTSVHDSALIMGEFLKYDDLVRMAGEETFSYMPNNMVPETRQIDNDNAMLVKNGEFYYQNAVAGSVYDSVSGSGINNYISVAGQNEARFIISLGNSVSRADSYSDSIRLYEWAFSNFNTVKLISKGDKITEWPAGDGQVLELISGENFYYTQSAGTSPKTEFGVDFKPLNVSGEIKKNQLMGSADVLMDNQIIGEIPLLSGSDKYVKPYDPNSNPTVDLIKNIGTKVLIILLNLLLLLFIIRTINKLNASRRKRKELEKKKLQIKTQLEKEKWKKEQKERRSRINRSGF